MQRISSGFYPFAAAAFAQIGGLAYRYLAPALALLSVLALTVPAHAGEAILVSKCTILARPGFYTATGDIATGSKGDCIIISASNVTFQDTFMITGPGASSVGAAIHILPGNTNVYVQGNDLVGGGPLVESGFNVGILDEGSWATVQHFSVDGNVTAGVFLKGVKGSSFSNFKAGLTSPNSYGVYLLNTTGSTIDTFNSDSNDIYGVWLQSSSNNNLHNFLSFENGIAGVYLGRSPNGSFGNGSPSPGSGNQVFNATIPSNNTGSVGYGVVIDKGETNNRVADDLAHSNDTDDLFDLNLVCDRNLWFGNDFDMATPTCIH